MVRNVIKRLLYLRHQEQHIHVQIVVMNYKEINVLNHHQVQLMQQSRIHVQMDITRVKQITQNVIQVYQ